MAEPVCRSLDQPPTDTDGPRVFVRDQNWKLGETNEDPLEPLFVKRWRIVSQPDWNVPAPPKSQDLLKDPPDPNPSGATPSGLQGFDFTGLFPVGTTRMDVDWEVYASTHSRYVRQDGSVAYDAREWATVPARFTVTVTKSTPAPPPPPTTYEHLRDEAKAELALALKLVTESGRKPRVSAPRVYWAHRLLTDPEPARAFAALAKVWPT